MNDNLKGRSDVKEKTLVSEKGQKMVRGQKESSIFQPCFGVKCLSVGHSSTTAPKWTMSSKIHGRIPVHPRGSL